MNDIKEITDSIEKLQLKHDDIILIKSNNHRDGSEIKRIMEELEFTNIVIHITEDVDIKTLPEDLILGVAEDIKKRREGK